MMTFDEALEYLNSIAPFIPKKLAPNEEPFNLEKISRLLHKLGDPQEKLRFIHVTGSNGKGSSSAFLTEILTQAGYRTGLYTSPAIQSICERIRIGRDFISEEEFAGCIEQVRAYALEMEEEGDGFPSEFEQVTAAAMLYFLKQHCDLVVLEVGLGGRLDATNVIPSPLLAIFTPVSLEHTEVLGDTLSKIATEKAGIIKEGSRVLTAPQKEEVDRVLTEVCEKKRVPLYHALMPVSRSFEEGIQSFHLPIGRSLRDSWFRTQMAAPYQAENASLAIQAALLLSDMGFSVPQEALKNGVFETRWPGRFEFLCKDPYVIVDGSHNPAGVKVLLEGLDALFNGRKIRFLAGVLSDKNYEEMIQEAMPYAHSFYTVTPPSPRALSAEDLAACIRRMGGTAYSCQSISQAVGLILGKTEREDVVCAFGSLYQLGEVRNCFREILQKEKT